MSGLFAQEESFVKYFIVLLTLLGIVVWDSLVTDVSAKTRPTPRPTATPSPLVNYHWTMGSNATLLSEGGDYTMAWWPWFKQRPVFGKAFVLMNHGSEKTDPLGNMNGSAFSVNGAESVDLVEFYYNKKLVKFLIYQDVYIMAPRWSKGNIVAAQISGPMYSSVAGSGYPLAGVRVFTTQSQFEKWVQKVNP